MYILTIVAFFSTEFPVVAENQHFFESVWISGKPPSENFKSFLSLCFCWTRDASAWICSAFLSFFGRYSENLLRNFEGFEDKCSKTWSEIVLTARRQCGAIKFSRSPIFSHIFQFL